MKATKKSKIGLNKETGLILALDLTDREKALGVVEKTKTHIDAVKINYPLVLSCGPELVNKISEMIPVICDFKIADIPNTSRLIAENAFERGASAVIAHGFSGVDSLETIRQAADSAGGMVFSVVEMSHPGAQESYAHVTDRLIKISLKAGVKGFIAPGTRTEKIRHIRKLAGPDAVILSPGIGAQGGSGRKAMENGSDFIIVGRAIYNSENPGEKTREIMESLLA